MNTDRIKELEVMIKFGDEVIEEYKQNDEEVPKFVYEKMIALHEELIGLLKADTKALNMVTEAMKAANKVFENKGVQVE